MTKRTTAILAGVCLLTAINIALFFAMRRFNEMPRGAQQTHQDATQEAVGAALQYRSAIGREPLKSVIRNLQVEHTYLATGFQSERIGEQEDFDRVLSNPRTARLIELLSQGQESPLAQAKSICDEMREHHREAIARWILSEEDAQAPKTNEPLNGTKLGVGAAIFALAHFAQPSDIVDAIEAMEKDVEQSLARMTKRPEVFSTALCSLTSRVARLDNSFKVSVLAFCARRNNDTMPALSKNIDLALSGLEQAHVPLTRTDARVGVYEQAHTRFGQEVDPREVIETVIVYHWGRRLFDQAYQEKLLKMVVSASTSGN